MLLAIWHYGGAMRRVKTEQSAFGSRRTPYLFSVDAIWDDRKRSEADHRLVAWADRRDEAVLLRQPLR